MELLLIIILTNLVVYFRTLRYELVSDALYCDFEKLKEKRFSLKYYWGIFVGNENHYNYQVEHAITIFIHTLNCSLIYLVFGSNVVSFMAAMLFAINPYNSQCSIGTTNKVYQRYLTLLLLSYNTILFIPVLLISYWKRFGMIFDKRRHKIVTRWHREISLRKLPVLFKTIGYYFYSCIVPIRLGIYSNYLEAYCFTEEEMKKWLKPDLFFFIGIMCCVLSFFIKPILIFVLVILPFSNYPCTMSQAIAQRYAYMANAWAMLLVASLCNWYLFIAVFSAYITRLILHIGAYRNYDLYLDEIGHRVNAPNNITLALVKGYYKKRTADAFTVMASYIEGLKSRPFDNRLNFMIGELCVRLKMYEQAVHHLQIAEDNPLDVVGCLSKDAKNLKEKCLEYIGERDRKAKDKK